MRIYLDSAKTDEIVAAARLPWVAGVTTNPEILQKAGVNDFLPVLEVAAATGRRDWKLWVQLADAPYQGVLDQAGRLEELLSARTGGLLAGPTLVFKLPPVPEVLLAGSTLIRQGKEVCITGTANAVQALSVCALPTVVEFGDGGLETEGPPASRNPGSPGFIAFYVGRVSDSGRDGKDEVVKIGKLFSAYGIRTRILAASIRSPEILGDLVGRLAAAGSGAVDVTLPMEMLAGALDDPVTSAALARFATLAGGSGRDVGQ